MAEELRTLLSELTCGDDLRAEAAVAELAKFGTEALPPLKTLLISPETDARWWGIRTLAQMDAPPTDWLQAALKDPSGEVRQCAALALVHHPDLNAISDLVGMLADPEPVCAELAADALCALRAQAVPPLLAVLENGPYKARLEALRALACIKDQRAIPALMAALEEDSVSMQFWAEDGLERLGLNMVYLKPE